MITGRLVHQIRQDRPAGWLALARYGPLVDRQGLRNC